MNLDAEAKRGSHQYTEDDRPTGNRLHHQPGVSLDLGKNLYPEFQSLLMYIHVQNIVQ